MFKKLPKLLEIGFLDPHVGFLITTVKFQEFDLDRCFSSVETSSSIVH